MSVAPAVAARPRGLLSTATDVVARRGNRRNGTFEGVALPRAPVPAGSHRPSSRRFPSRRRPTKPAPAATAVPTRIRKPAVRSLSPLLTVGSSRTGCSSAGAGVDDVGTVATRGSSGNSDQSGSGERARLWPIAGAGTISAVATRTRAAAIGAAHQRMVSGVPTGRSRASRRMSWLRMRMHPCETRPGRSSGLVRPVDADEAARGPVGQHFRAGARPERDRTVERAAVARQAVADVELPARRRPLRRADADAGAEDPLAGSIQRRGQSLEIDDESRADDGQTVRAPRAAPSPSCCSAGPAAGHASTPGRCASVARPNASTRFAVCSAVRVARACHDAARPRPVTPAQRRSGGRATSRRRSTFSPQRHGCCTRSAGAGESRKRRARAGGRSTSSASRAEDARPTAPRRATPRRPRQQEEDQPVNRGPPLALRPSAARR